MNKAIYPGTFDPVTLGHLDIIERSGKIFDKVIVAIGNNPAKKPLFSFRERMDMMKKETARYQYVKVMGFQGLLVDFARKQKVSTIIRGIRTMSEFEYELQMALTNRSIAGTETIFLSPRPEYAFLSAQLIRQVAGMGGDVSSMVAPNVLDRLAVKFRRKRSK